MTTTSLDIATLLIFSIAFVACAGSSPGAEKSGHKESDQANSLDPSKDPPGGLTSKQVPMFVTIGFDDNAYSGLEGSGGEGGMNWATEMLKGRSNPDGTRAGVSFFLSSINMENPESEAPDLVKNSWKAAALGGHEIGNHTHSHPHGQELGVDNWTEEMSACNSKLTTEIGIEQGNIRGFRTPFLEYNDATLKAASKLGFSYDCSIEEGYQVDQDGSNFFWPYTLHDGSPGNEILVEWELKKPISGHPGLFEMPVYVVIVPPDDKCEAYGVQKGLRAKMKGYQDWFEEESGKITGFDYNLWVMFKMTKAEFLATLKYSFDLRINGNRAPFLFGAHTDVYSTKYENLPDSTVKDRQEAVEEFLDYVLSKPEVRVLPMEKILAWIQNPIPLS